MTTDEMLLAVWRWSLEHHPQRPAVRLRIDLAGGEKVLLPMPAFPAAAGPASAKLTEADKTILQAVAELGEAPTGPEIARVAGYPYGPHLKTRLSLLRRRGLLGGQAGDQGYTLTEAAAELLAAETGDAHA